MNTTAGKNIIDDLNNKWQVEYPGISQLCFSNYIPWAKREDLLNMDKVGVYIMWEDLDDMANKPIFADPLEVKVIYIGKTEKGDTSLRKRLQSFHRSAYQGKHGHVAGWTYREKHNQEAPKNLYVSICPIYWDKEPKKEITDLLQKNLDTYKHVVTSRLSIYLEVCLRGSYVRQHGRLPSLNKE